MKYIKLILTGLIILFAAQTVFADDCQLEITANDAMQFSATEMAVPSSCKEVTLTLKHIGKLAANVMGHNWVLTTADDFSSVASDGMSAGLDNNYVSEDDERVLAFTKIIGGGEETSTTFSIEALSADQEYSFFCSFPGHWGIMKGAFKIIN